VNGLALLDDRRPDAGWPNELLDVDAHMRTGWRPTPFRQFILKVHSRCNLACDYCYVYRSADQSWRQRPSRMSRATAVRAAERIAEHVRIHHLPNVGVILHGGEPLLAGPDFLDFLCATLRSSLGLETDLDLYVQTNATLLNPTTLGVFDDHGVRVGVSLDGDPVVHDRGRRHGAGSGSHSEASRGLELLRAPEYRYLFAGLLCVVDLRGDPVATYEHLLSHEPPTVDFLLPHANWSNPPGGRRADVAAPYGEWLVAAFDRWYSAPRPETSVRLFEEIIRGVLGRPSRVESIGLSPAVDIVVDTDGTIEQSDSLKSAYEGAAFTGLNVHDHAFDAALLLPPIAARQLGSAALADTCRRCSIHKVCGGGFYPHRYRRGEGFRNPSVYCNDLERLIRHVHSRVGEDLSRTRKPRDDAAHAPG
jgi:uncharacterized protein